MRVVNLMERGRKKRNSCFFDSLGLVPDTSPGCAKKAILTTSSEIVELVPVTKLAAFSWILLYNIASPVTESNQYVFRKY